MSKVKKNRQLSEDEKTMIKDTFESLDTDKDGLLNYQEMKSAVKALGFDAKKLEILNMMKCCDKAEDKMDYENFYYIMADKMAKRDPIDGIKIAYKLLCEAVDAKTIGLVELKKINTKFNTKFSNEEMRAMIQEFDTDGDGCSKKVIMNFGINSEAEQRQTLLEGRASLDRASQSVARSQVVAAETEQLGREVINELGGQREILLRAKRRLSETDHELNASRKVMRLITRRVLTNKLALILIIVLEVAILALTVYLKFFLKK